MPDDKVTLFSIVVVAMNEQDYLPLLLGDIVAQDFPHADIEVLLVDSNAGANHAQRKTMEDFAAAGHGFRRVTVLDNEKVHLPGGCNVALDSFAGDVFCRVDAHARIPADFVRRNVEVLHEGRQICGGPRPVVLEAPTPWARTLLAAETSIFGASAAAYRRTQRAEPVSSIFHGAYRRDALAAVGRYDERLRRTEDNDFSQRLRAAGLEIWSDPRIRSEQYLRPTFSKLLRQKAANGYWIGRTMWINPRAVSLMHLVPAAFVFSLLAGLVIGLFLSWLPLGFVLASYVLAAVAASIEAAVKAKPPHWSLAALPLVFFAMHSCYGCGSWAGLTASIAERLRKQPAG